MFGDVPRPKKSPNRKKIYVRDLHCAGVIPGQFQHIARAANSNQHVRLQEYKLKKDSLLDARLKEEELRLLHNKHMAATEKSGRNMILRKRIEDKLHKKFTDYEKSVEARRAKLADLLAKEERQYYRETVDQAQKGDDKKLEGLIRRGQEIKARREAERLQFAEEKRLQQYGMRSEDLRLYYGKKLLMDSKEAQLIQMKEQEMKKNREKELDEMWHQVTLKEVREKAIRDEQHLIKQRMQMYDLRETWQKQIQGKKLVEAERIKIKEEDYEELERMKAEREAIEECEKEKLKIAKLKFKEELEKQIAQNNAIAETTKFIEDTFDKELQELVRREVEKEAQTQTDNSVVMRREAKMYKKHLEDLKQQKQQEEDMLNEMLKNYQNEIDEKTRQAYCQQWNVKEKQRREVLKIRAEQIEFKKKQEEEERKRLQEEHETVQKIFEMNDCLERDFLRREHEKKKAYREDLRKQIEYNRVLKEREAEEVDRSFKKCADEEAYFQKKLEEAINYNVKDEGRMKHRFEIVLDRQSKPPCILPCCPCPDPEDLPEKE